MRLCICSRICVWLCLFPYFVQIWEMVNKFLWFFCSPSAAAAHSFHILCRKHSMVTDEKLHSSIVFVHFNAALSKWYNIIFFWGGELNILVCVFFWYIYIRRYAVMLIFLCKFLIFFYIISHLWIAKDRQHAHSMAERETHHIHKSQCVQFIIFFIDWLPLSNS